jgi:hypothetical protein
MLEEIHELLYAILRLYIASAPSGELSPNMLNSLGKFTEYYPPIASVLLWLIQRVQDTPQDPHFCRSPTREKHNQTVLSSRGTEHAAQSLSAGLATST